jgi:hypothetical protein
MAINKSERTESEIFKYGIDQSKEKLTVAADKFRDESDESLDNAPSEVFSEIDLQKFKNITNQIMQDALHVWAQLWGELESRVPSEDRKSSCVAEKGMSSSEWTEFIEKMWLLRHYLDFTKRLSQQEQ